MIKFNIDTLEYTEDGRDGAALAFYTDEFGIENNCTPYVFMYISHDKYLDTVTKTLSDFKNSTIKSLPSYFWRVITATQVSKHLHKFSSINSMNINVTFTRSGLIELSSRPMSIKVFLRSKTNRLEVKQATFNHDLVKPYDIENRINISTLFYNDVQLLIEVVNKELVKLMELISKLKDEK